MVAVAFTVLSWIVVERRGNLAWDDADYLRRGLRIAGLASQQGHLNVVRALGQTLRDRPKPPWLVGWIELGALVLGRERLTALIVYSSAIPFAILCLVVMTVAARRYGATAGLLAVLGLLASPMAVSYGAKVMVETFLALWILLVYESASRFLESATPLRAATLGAALGLALLTKLTVALFFPVSATVFLWQYLRRHGLDRSTWRPLLALAVPLLLIAGPWYFKNGVTAVRFAAFSARYQVLAEGKTTVLPIPERVAALGEQILGWPLLATLLLVTVPILARLVRGKRAPCQAGDAFLVLVFVGAGSAASVLMLTSYFDPRFLLPIWGALAVCVARLIQLASARLGSISTGLAIALLATGVYRSVDALCSEPRTRTYWTAQALIDELVVEHNVKTIGNVGNCSDWNVCKTGLINELRRNPADCFVLHDLSKDEEPELGRRLGRLDAVIILDRADLPPGFLEASPGLNRAYGSIGGVLAQRTDYRKLEPRVAGDLPPLSVYVRRR